MGHVRRQGARHGKISQRYIASLATPFCTTTTTTTTTTTIRRPHPWRVAAATSSTAALQTEEESVWPPPTTNETNGIHTIDCDDTQASHANHHDNLNNGSIVLTTAPEMTHDGTAPQPTTNEPLLLDPEKDFNMTYPKALSPSAINEFLNCPQSFLFQYIYGIKQPTTTALAKGTMCHAALEQVFELDAADRTLEHLQNLMRKEWSQNRKSDQYGQLFVEDDGNWNLEAEADWGREALQLLENYVNYEDPRLVERPNPVQREVWVKANLSLDPRKGATGYVVADEAPDDHATTTSPDETFLVRGIVDRLDMVRSSDNKSVVLRLTDYKTGKAPELKYSPAFNEQLVAQNFFQLQIYALLLREKNNDRQQTMDLRYLRLLYLTSAQGPAVAWDYDLGETQAERDAILQGVHAKLSKVWMDIVELVSQQDPRSWKGCDRMFCYCHKCRPKFLPGSVWEPRTEG